MTLKTLFTTVAAMEDPAKNYYGEFRRLFEKK